MPSPMLALLVGPAALPLTREIVAGIAEAASSRWDVRVGPGAALDPGSTTLAVGGPEEFVDLLPAVADAPIVLWTGEPLGVPGRAANGPIHLLAHSPLRRAIRGPLRFLRSAPLPGPVARLRSGVIEERLATNNLAALHDVYPRLGRLVVTSRDRAAVARAAGLAASVTPFGYAPAFAGRLTEPGDSRDVEILVLGVRHREGAGRRRALVERFQATEPRLMWEDATWGSARNALLRRSKVVLDVHRVPGNFVGVRLVLALAAGAVVVTEPMTDPHPFVPGVHFVEAPASDLLDAARALLADEGHRQAIVRAGQDLLATELRMERCLERALG